MSDLYPHESIQEIITTKDIFNGRPATNEQLTRLLNIQSYFSDGQIQADSPKNFSFVHNPIERSYTLTQATANGREKVSFEPLALEDDEGDLMYSPVFGEPVPFKVSWQPSNQLQESMIVETSVGGILVKDIWFGDTKETRDRSNNLNIEVLDQTMAFVERRIDGVLLNFLDAAAKATRPPLYRRIGGAILNSLTENPIVPGWL
jgi:hypothetical protein